MSGVNGIEVDDIQLVRLHHDLALELKSVEIPEKNAAEVEKHLLP